MADRSLLRLSATLVVIGELLFALVTLFHADGEANNHPAVFAEYASSASWIAVHLGQFVFMAVLLLGLLVLFFALNVRSGALGWVGRFAAVSVVVALALYGVVQAVRILLVACLKTLNLASSSLMPKPSSLTSMRSRPPSAISTSTRVAPASKGFSESSFTTEAGRSTTSPAATC